MVDLDLALSGGKKMYMLGGGNPGRRLMLSGREIVNPGSLL